MPKKVETSVRLRADLHKRVAELHAVLKTRLPSSATWIIEKCLEAHLPAMEAEAGLLHDRPGPTPPAGPAKPTKYPPPKRSKG